MNDRQVQTEDGDIWQTLRQRLDEMRRQEGRATDPESRARKLAKRSQVVRGQLGRSRTTGPQISFLAFSQGPERYGILLPHILEIQPLQDYTPVPGAPPFIPGVIHSRGVILSLLHLGRLFEIPEAGISDVHACIIVEAAGRRVSVAASEVEDLISVPATEVSAAPSLTAEIPEEWALGVYDANRLILRMDQVLSDDRLTSG